jgi:hypothetical protein
VHEWAVPTRFKPDVRVICTVSHRFTFFHPDPSDPWAVHR